MFCSLSRCLRGNLAPADELSGVADELLSLQVSQRQSAPADELSGRAADSAEQFFLPPKMAGAEVNVTSDVIA